MIQYCKPCSFCNRASTKERNKSWLVSCNVKRLYIKMCRRCFFCHSIALCPICNKCPSCCDKSTCKGQASKLLANLAGNGCRSENSSDPRRGLHPPLSDPTKSHKISHHHKLLWQSSQEQLPVGGIISAYGEKCCRTSTQSDLPRVFQPAILSTQTQQQMEANSSSEQTKSLSQGGEIQNGDTRNHQDIPPTRGVGHLSRLQGCLLPYPNTGTIQEISQISCPVSDLPIQSIAFRSVHSTHGVHCVSKGGETDGHTQGYKNPPVPRRLVGESQIPPDLSPTYTNFSKDMSRTRLAGEHRQIRTGTQASLQLHRLPVRPQGRPGQTDTGLVAKPSGQNTSTLVNASLSGPAVHAPDRPANSHRKASSPWPTTHETHSVASQKQLEGTGISREDYPSSQVPAPALTMVTEGKQCTPRSTITPNKTCSANFYRCFKRRVGHSLKQTYCKRVLVSTGKQTAHTWYLELKAVFIALIHLT